MIGLAVGAQLYVLAAGATALSWFVLAVLVRLSREIEPEQVDEDEVDD